MSEFPFAAGEHAPQALPPEISFLEGLPGVVRPSLEIAARKARMQGVGADEVLIAEGLVGESDYYRALADQLGCPFVERAAALAPGFDYRAAMRASVARTAGDREAFDWLLAPRGSDVADLLRLTERGRKWRFARGRIAICAPRVFSALVRATARAALARDASFALSRADATLSASAPKVRWSNYVALCLSAALLLGMATASPGVLQVAPAIMSVFFLGGIYVRLCASAASLLHSQPKPKPLSDFELPTYTILAPMYREAGVAAQFIAALKGLDYPPAKLEIKLVIEDDDRETAAALRRARLAPNMEIVVAPAGMPRAKPRAMNVALPMARGELLTIFDAEDRPERDQLRVAAAAFAAAGPDVACFQARLVVDNAHESIWAHFFAIGYAALFDALNPGLALLGLPMPLGGTSNHFRTRLLRRALGWDAWNVTEDADLGLRLARFGFRVGAIDSVTYEDAPLRFASWLGQRARWMKGWMQTLAVFLGACSPTRAFSSSVGGGQIRTMGAFQAFAALSAMICLIAGPLFGPFYVLRLMVDLFYGDLLSPRTFGDAIAASLSLNVAVLGLLAYVLPNLIGMARRRIAPSWRMVLAPLYLLAMSVACWRALWEWTRRPFAWTKTDHAPRPVPARAPEISGRLLSTP